MQRKTLIPTTGNSGLSGGYQWNPSWPSHLERSTGTPNSQREIFLCGEALQRMQRLHLVCKAAGAFTQQMHNINSASLK